MNLDNALLVLSDFIPWISIIVVLFVANRILEKR